MIKDLVICACLLSVGNAGIIFICFVPMSHSLTAVIGIFSSALAIVGGVGLWTLLDDTDGDDDDDGPHFYGPGGTII